MESLIEEWRKRDPYFLDVEGFERWLEEKLEPKWYLIFERYESVLGQVARYDVPRLEKMGYKVKVEHYTGKRQRICSDTWDSEKMIGVFVDKPLSVPSIQELAKMGAEYILGHYAEDWMRKMVLKAYEQGDEDLAVKILKEHNLGGGGSTSLMGDWSFIEYSRGKGVSIELGPPAYPRLKVTISWEQVVEYALEPNHEFKAKILGQETEKVEVTTC